MFHLNEYEKRPRKLAQRLPWAALVAPGVILNKMGSFQSTIQFRGPDLFSSTQEELDVVSAQVNNALKRLGSGWAFFVEAQRRKSEEYPVSQWPTPASRLIDTERRGMFLGEGNHFETTYYFTFSYMPPSEKMKNLSERFFESEKGKETVNYRVFMEGFQDEVRKIVDILKTVFPLIKVLKDDETLTYLHSCISTKYHRVRTPNTPMFLDYILPDQILEGGLEPKLGDSYLKVLSIKGFPQESEPQMLNDLDKLGLEYRWSTRFICMDKAEALKELKKYSSQWFGKRKGLWALVKEAAMNEVDDRREDSDAVTKSEECDAMAEMVAGGLVSAGYYTSSIIVWDKDRAALREKASAIEQVVNSAGFVAVNESFNAIQAWLGSLPGHCWANIRRPLMTSLNLSHLLPVSTDWAGEEKNRHLNGPPLFYAKTNSNTPFRFSNHVGDVGHAMILGPTGTGKSVLVSFSATSFLRYPNAQVYIFDKDYSAKCATLANNGDHYDLGENAALSFQPLRNIDNDLERAWATEWILGVLAQENVPITPALKTEIYEALTNLSTSPAEQRTMTGLVALLQNKDLREALGVYTISGAFGYLLDAKEDSLELKRWQCFEMNYLMSYTPGVVVPVLSYLFHRLDERFTGDPSVIILDEAWLFFSHPVFAAKIKDWLKTLRKKNVSVIFATQSLADVKDSPILHTLTESCPTRIFLPNRKALEPAVSNQYAEFGLNERQIEIIAQALPKREYYCQSDLGHRKFELGLGPVSLALCGSSSQADLAVIDQMPKEDFVEQFLTQKGVSDAQAN